MEITRSASVSTSLSGKPSSIATTVPGGTRSVLFYGAGAREVSERLAGSSIPDFYGAYLEDRLAQARAAVADRLLSPAIVPKPM